MSLRPPPRERIIAMDDRQPTRVGEGIRHKMDNHHPKWTAPEIVTEAGRVP